MVLQGHKKKILYISITRMPMANKLGRIMISLDGLLPIITHDLLIMRPCEIRGSLTWGGSARKRLSRHRLLVYSLIAFSTGLISSIASQSKLSFLSTLLQLLILHSKCREELLRSLSNSLLSFKRFYYQSSCWYQRIQNSCF